MNTIGMNLLVVIPVVMERMCTCRRSLALICSLPFVNTAAQVLAAIHKFISRSDFDLQVLGDGGKHLPYNSGDTIPF